MKARKRFVGAAFVTAIAIAMTGCAAGNSGGDDQKVTLRFALWDPGWAVGYKASIAEFEKLNPNIDVKIEQTVWDQYWTQLTTQLAAGTGPDVFNNHSSYYTYFAGVKAIQPLDKLAKSAGYDWGTLNPDLLKTWVGDDGKKYGAPTEADTIAIAYNRDLLKKANLTDADVNSLVWNPDDGGTFLAAMQNLTIDANGKKANEPGFDPAHIKQYGMSAPATFGQGSWWNFVASNGGQIQSKPFGDWTLTDPKTEAGIQFMWDLMYKYHVAYPATLAADQDKAFASGQTATYWRGSWNINGDKDTFAKLDWGITKVPDGAAGAGASLDSTGMSITTATKHPKEAWKLVQWLVSSQSQALMGGGGYYWPAVKSETQTFVDYWADKKIDVKAFAPGEGALVRFPVQNNYNAADTLLNQLLQPMWLGQKTPAETLPHANEAVNKVGK